MYCLHFLVVLLFCFVLFWHNSFSTREEDILISMLRLLEYERATVDAEGAIGLAALVAGKLPELKGKRYSSYCKWDSIRNCGKSMGPSALVMGNGGTCFMSDAAVSVPALPIGLSIASTSGWRDHRSEDHVELDKRQCSQMTGRKAVMHICYESILLLPACCLHTSRMWKSTPSVVGPCLLKKKQLANKWAGLSSAVTEWHLPSNPKSSCPARIALVLSVNCVGKSLLASGLQHSVLKQIEPWLKIQPRMYLNIHVLKTKFPIYSIGC